MSLSGVSGERYRHSILISSFRPLHFCRYEQYGDQLVESALRDAVYVDDETDWKQKPQADMVCTHTRKSRTWKGNKKLA